MKIKTIHSHEEPSRFKNRHNYKSNGGIKPEGESLTVQNEATSIATMLQRYARGETLTGLTGLYDDNTDLESLDLEEFVRMDRTEQEDVLEGIKAMSERFRQLQKEADEAKKAKPPKQPENEGE